MPELANYAYVTTLTHGDSYLPGVEVLGKSLRLSGSEIPMMVLVSSDVSRQARSRLRGQGWQVREVEEIENPTKDSHRLYPRFSHVFTKLRAWELTEFKRVISLDADTLVLQNIDSLFERGSFAAAPDFLMPDRFNSGVMLLEPSLPMFSHLVHTLAHLGSYDGGDQGFLNTIYSDWYQSDPVHRLPIGYNMAHFIYAFLRGHSGLEAHLLHEVKVVHYMVQKPWLSRSTLTGGSGAWWEMYFATHPEKSSAWKARVHRLEDWCFDHLVTILD